MADPKRQDTKRETEAPGGGAARDSETHEVRAGPGDAGRQDRPETLPRVPNERRRARSATLLLAALVAVAAIVLLVLWGAS